MAQVTRIVSGGVQNGPLLPNLSKPHKPTPPFTTPFLRSGPNVSSFSLKHERAVSNSVVSVRARFRISASVATKEKPSTAPEIVLQPIKEISGTITLPGSKSLSNRILLLAALSEGLDMMGELCLGALKLQGRRQSFWGLQMGRDTAGLLRKTGTEETEEARKGKEKKKKGEICRKEGGEESGAE